jgi:hypothetical protein
MSAARILLADLAAIGATVELAGDQLILSAGPTGIPGPLVHQVRQAKADLLAVLGGLSRNDAERIAFECRIVEWLNLHPNLSPAGRCTWCGNSETASAVVLPFGTEPGTHAWLHAECWAAWYRARRADAVKALATAGVKGPPDKRNAG